jgi:hypothetical protein
VFYEIAIDQPGRGSGSAARCRLAWWEDPPAAWEELAAWVRRAEAVFEAAWAAHGAPAPPPLPHRPD